MEEESILREDGLLSIATSLRTEDCAACPEDTLLNSEDEFPPKPPRSPNKRRRDTPRGSYEDPAKEKAPPFSARKRRERQGEDQKV